MDETLEDIYAAANKGALPKQYLEIMLNQDYDDYNSDYGSQIHFIIKSILDNDENIIQNEQTSQLIFLVGNEAFGLFSNFFDKVIRNNLEINSHDFNHILKFNPPQLVSDDKIIDYIFGQNNFNLSELQLLKVFTAHKKIAKKILSHDKLQITQPLYDYLNQHYYYKDIIKDKKINIVESKDRTIKILSEQLLFTENYIHDLEINNIPYKKEGVSGFFKETYHMIFDESNFNRDKFTFEFAKKKIDIAVESMKYPQQFDLKTIAQMRKNPNNPFGKLKKT